MFNTAMSSTLRELRSLMARPQTWAIFVVIAVILAIIAPFDTDLAMRWVPRALYWFGIVASTFAAGFVVSGVIALAFQGWAPPMRMALMACATAAVVVPLVLGLNWVLLGFWPDAPGALAAQIFALAVLINFALDLRSQTQARPSTEATVAPPLLDRLPLEKRGALLALCVEDHYVRVITTAGEEMVLMRLSDAIRETPPEAGLQIHRSHWVALKAVAAARRQGDRAILTLTNGQELPVSRANVAAVRAAGLLPR